MEWHIDARHRDEGTRGDGGGALAQLSQARLGAGDGILLAGDIVVDDLQELAGFSSHLGDVILHVVGADTNHVRAQRTHAVVGIAVLVALDQGAHRGTTRVDDIDDSFQVEDIRQRGQRGVFTQGVAGVHGIGSKCVVLA